MWFISGICYSDRKLTNTPTSSQGAETHPRVLPALDEILARIMVMLFPNEAVGISNVSHMSRKPKGILGSETYNLY